MSSATVRMPLAGEPPITQPAASSFGSSRSMALFRSSRAIARFSGLAKGGPPGAGDGTLPATASTRVSEAPSPRAIPAARASAMRATSLPS